MQDDKVLSLLDVAIDRCKKLGREDLIKKLEQFKEETISLSPKCVTALKRINRLKRVTVSMLEKFIEDVEFSIWWRSRLPGVLLLSDAISSLPVDSRLGIRTISLLRPYTGKHLSAEQMKFLKEFPAGNNSERALLRAVENLFPEIRSKFVHN